MTTILENEDFAQTYGTMLNQNIAQPLQHLFHKFIKGEELRIFPNEIKGVGTIDWQEFPKALVVSEKAIKCEPIVDKLTEVKELLNLLDE